MAADLDRLIQHSQFLISNLQYPIFNFPFSFSHSSFPIIPRFSNIPHLTLQLKLFAFILDLINNSFKIGFFFQNQGRICTISGIFWLKMQTVNSL